MNELNEDAFYLTGTLLNLIISIEDTSRDLNKKFNILRRARIDIRLFQYFIRNKEQIFNFIKYSRKNLDSMERILNRIIDQND